MCRNFSVCVLLYRTIQSVALRGKFINSLNLAHQIHYIYHHFLDKIKMRLCNHHALKKIIGESACTQDNFANIDHRYNSNDYIIVDKYLCELKVTLLGYTCISITQQNSYSISHLLDTVTARWLNSDCVVTVDNYRQHGDWAANCNVVTVLPGLDDSDYTVTVQSPCSHCV